jgi:hypothetical protein
VALCYGISNDSSSSNNRRHLWKKKTDSAKLSSKPPTLSSLPPTDPVLELNIKPAHFQAMLWINCIDRYPPQRNPCEYGWERGEEMKTLKPILFPTGTKIAPDEVLHSSRCTCKCKNTIYIYISKV